MERRRIEAGEKFRHGPYTIREARDGDRDGIVASFNRVFSEGNPHFEPRTAAEWEWEFVRNPAGRQVWIAVHEDGTVAAHFAGLPMRARLDEREVILAHIVDSYTHPQHRSGLKRPGLFVLTANAYVDRFMWPEVNLVNFGFPIPEAWRVGERLIGYVAVRTQLHLMLDLARAEAFPAAAASAVTELGAAGPDVDALCRRCVRAGEVMGVRDAAFLEWRYRTHPRLKYRIGAVRDGASLRGLAVFREGWFSDAQQGLLVDWLVPDSDPEAARALVAWGAERAREASQAKLGLLLADCDPWWLLLQETGFRVAGTKYVLVHGDIGRAGQPDERWLRGRWRYTLGETDLA